MTTVWLKVVALLRPTTGLGVGPLYSLHVLQSLYILSSRVLIFWSNKFEFLVSALCYQGKHGQIVYESLLMF